jgi:hypothetical protein
MASPVETVECGGVKVALPSIMNLVRCSDALLAGLRTV